MNVSILSASSSLYQGKAVSVALPGAKAAFTVLENHAPIVSVLEKGTITIDKEGADKVTIDIKGGFVEVHNNELTACVEI